MNCKETETYLKEKGRMTNNCGDDFSCTECPLSQYKNKAHYPCGTYQSKYPLEAIEIVQAWSDSHMVKTYLDDFKEKFPNNEFKEKDFFTNNGECCVMDFYGTDCSFTNCKDCWSAPIKWPQHFKQWHLTYQYQC